MPAAEITIHPGQTVRFSSPGGVPVREDVLLTDARGVERHGDNQRIRRAIEKLQQPLGRILEPGEVVLYFARAQLMPGKPERYLLGVQSHYLGQGALIFTNRRLYYLSLKRNGQWDRNLRHARWGDVKAAQVSGVLYGKIQIEYLQGSKETYWRVRNDAAQKIRLLLDVLRAASGGETSPAMGMASFCPQCLGALTPGIYNCPHCGLKFKDEGSALRHALLVPGGGYFYVGLNLWGIMHAFIDVAILFSAIMWGRVALGLEPPPPLPGPPHGRGTFTFFAVFLASLLLTDVWLAVRIARNAVRNFIPN